MIFTGISSDAIFSNILRTGASLEQYIVLRLLQKRNAPMLKQVTLFGMTIVARFAHPKNANVSTVVP
jgi:hypothetical protein